MLLDISEEDRMSRTKEKATVFIKMSATKEEREKIRECSEHNNLSISDLIRVGLNTIGGLDLEYGNKRRKAQKK